MECVIQCLVNGMALCCLPRKAGGASKYHRDWSTSPNEFTLIKSSDKG